MKVIIYLFLLITSIQSFAKQTIIIGALPYNPPFTMAANMKGAFFGFEVAILNEICRRIDANCRYTPKTFMDLFTAIDNNSIDLAIGAIIISPERQTKHLFSLPYLISKGNFMTHNNKIKSINELENKKIGVLKGNIYSILLQRRFGSTITLYEYHKIPELLFALSTGKIDAILIDRESAVYWAIRGNNLQILGQPIETGTGYGIMAKKTRTRLIQQINLELEKMEEDGSYLRIYNSFFE